MRGLLTTKNIIIALAILLVLALGAAAFLYEKAFPASGPSAQQQLQDTVAKVGKLMVLPTGEQPTMATVSDPSKLSDQPFFTNAQVGDIVLIYTQSRKAVLYRPSINKIIEVAPITIPSGSPLNTGTTTATI